MIYPALRPLNYQLPKWKARADGIRFFINSIHRRGGKDVDDLSMAGQDAIEYGGTHYYLFPTRAWAERAIFKEQFTVGGVTKHFWEWIIPKQLNPIPRMKDCSIELPHNGARIQFGGTDDLSFVGQGGKGYTLSEFSIHKKEVTGFIMPIVRQSGGYLRLNGTLRGRHNHLWEMIQRNKDNPQWFVQWLRPQDTKCYCWVDDEFEINPELMSRIGQIGPNNTPIFNVADDIASGVISHAMAMQEFLNEPISAFEFGYYTHEMKIAKGEGRLSADVKYDPNLPVFTFWDLGKGDSHNSTDAMAVWFVQVPNGDLRNPDKVNLIDYHESRGHDWAFYSRMINSKGYWYGNHYAPWDIAKGQAGHEKTNRDYARERGINFLTVKRGAKLSIDIEDCRRFWPKVTISDSENCVEGTELLESYHEKLNSDGVGTGKPDHDVSSNCADAFRTMVRAFTTGIVESNASGRMGFKDSDFKMEGFFD